VTTIVDGRKLAGEIRAEIRTRIETLDGAPGLATVLVGEDPASHVYVRNKHRACQEVGIHSVRADLPDSTSEAELLAHIERLNADPAVHGILVQLPLPAGIDAGRVARAIDPAKDVDGLHPENAGNLVANRAGLFPCTPLGCIEILDRHGIRIEGASAVVIGRSDIVGKPVGLMLLHRHATVTICHSRTRDLAERVRDADIVVAAIGRARFVKGDWIKPGAAVLDVGINRTDAGLVGDVDFDAARDRAGLITPVPGGVGPLTIALLLANTLRAFERRIGS